MDEDNGTEEMDIEETKENEEEAHGKCLPLEGLKFSATGVFPEIAEGKEPQWGPASDLYNGRNTLKCLVTLYGGQFNQSITKQTKFLIVGLTPSEKAIDKAHTGNVDLPVAPQRAKKSSVGTAPTDMVRVLLHTQ